MDSIIRWVLLVVGIALTVQTARPHFRYGDWLDPPATLEIFYMSIPFGMATIMALLHFGKGMMPAAAAMYWRRSQYMLSAMAFLLFLLLVAVSITGTLAFLDLQRGERAAVAETKLKREAELRAELAATEARLKNIGWWRAAAIVESEIAAERRHPFWAATEACSAAVTPQNQRYCRVLDRLAGELTAAREAENDRQREKQIRVELLGMKVTNTSAYPDLDFLSRALEVSLERAGFWRTVLFAAVIEFGEALFILFGTVPANSGRRPEGRRRLAMGLRTLYLTALAWIKSQPRRRADDASPQSQGTQAAGRPGSQQASRTGAARTSPRPEKISSSLLHARCPLQSQIRFEAVALAGAVAITPEEAVEAFVAACPRAPGARVAGSAMFAAYDKVRSSRGWPSLSRAVFGRHLKAAIKRAGGDKVKSNAQIYVGVALPPGW